jgi:hypothetical protein
MNAANVVPLTERQEREARLLGTCIVEQFEIESIDLVADIVALEYRLLDKTPRPDSRRSYRVIQGADTLKSDPELRAHFDAQLVNCTEFLVG